MLSASLCVYVFVRIYFQDSKYTTNVHLMQLSALHFHKGKPQRATSSLKLFIASTMAEMLQADSE